MKLFDKFKNEINIVEVEDLIESIEKSCLLF